MKKTLKMKRRIVSLFGFLSALLLCFFITQNSYAREQLSEEQVKKRLDAFNKYTKTLSIIEQYYVDDENLSDLIDKSISGLLSNLDAHSAFLDEKAFADMKIQTKGEFGGLGITISMKDGALTVIAPIEGTPADKAGIKAGDVIVKIDNQATIDMKLDEAVSKMRGKPGTSVSITVLRKTASKPIEIKLKRDTIKIESVYAKLVEDDDILYLRVTSFDQNVVDMASKYIKQYPKAKGIVLDLRNNPGGLLNQAIGLTNLFVDSGVIVSQKGRIEAENQEFKAIANKKITDAALTKRTPILPKDSILIVVRGMILAHTFPVARTLRDVTINQDMKGIIPSKYFLCDFIFHWFKNNDRNFLKLTEESTHGTKRISTDILFSMNIPKPPLEEQKKL